MNSTTDLEEQKYVFQMQQLEEKRQSTNRAFLPFLNVSTLHCGVYSLDENAKDQQTPHKEDEIYYVHSGQAAIQIDGIDYEIQPGSIVFVPAGVQHRFHSIKKDLKTLVFFSKAVVRRPDAEKNNSLEKKKSN